MEIISKTVSGLSELDYFTLHLQLINPLLRPVHLTSKEIEVLAAFMSFKNPIGGDRFGTSYRGEVKKQLGLSSGGLSNHIRSLSEKGAIYKGEDDLLQIRTFLFPEEQVQKYNFKIART